MVWFVRVARVVALLALFVLGAGAVLFVGPILDAGATGTWNSDGGGTEWSCGLNTDGSCADGGAGSLEIDGPGVLTLSTVDDSSGDDVELSIPTVDGSNSGTDPCSSVSEIATPAFIAETGSGDATSCDLSAGDWVYVELIDYGPYTSGGDVNVPFTPAVGPDDEAAIFTASGGGGGSSGTSAFSSLSGMVSWVNSAMTSFGPGIVAMGVALIGLAAAVFGIWYLFRLFRRMAS